MQWRVIGTDTESETGVAPFCDKPDVHEGGDVSDTWVYDCCPGPHIECWSPVVAETIASRLTDAEAEMCG